MTKEMSVEEKIEFVKTNIRAGCKGLVGNPLMGPVGWDRIRDVLQAQLKLINPTIDVKVEIDEKDPTMYHVSVDLPSWWADMIKDKIGKL